MQRKHNGALTERARELRRSMTAEERRLWYDFLQTYPVRFYRQKVLGRYIADFYCAAAGLVVELDGSQHFEEENAAKDARRTAFLQTYGLTVLRIVNNEIRENFSGVCEAIDQAVKRGMERKRGNGDMRR